MSTDWNTHNPEDRVCMRLLGLPVAAPVGIDPAVIVIEEKAVEQEPAGIYATLRASLIKQAREVIAGLATYENNIALSRTFSDDDDFRVSFRSGGMGVCIDLAAFGGFCRTHRPDAYLPHLHQLVEAGNLN